jgi:RimJ/RimL family protein N-acetyltransferase
VWLDGRLAGYVDCDPDNRDGLVDGDVNVSYATHPWARGRGVATAAVEQICEYIRAEEIGAAAVIRVEPANRASIRVAEKACFHFDREIASSTDFDSDGHAKKLRLYRRRL